MIQDIGSRRFDNHFRNVQPQKDDCLVFARERTILLRNTDNGIEFPRYGQTDVGMPPTIYLFSIGKSRFFLAEDDTSALDALFAMSYRYFDASEIVNSTPEWLRFAAITSCQLGAWVQNNRFCGRCGERMVQSNAERMLYCEACHTIVYPKICPAIIAGVLNGDRILVTKYAGTSESAQYALIAGFAEIGESIEETVRREVMEETGVRVKNIRFYKSQPWAMSDTLLLGFFCDLDGTDKIRMDKSELSCAKWAARTELPVQADGISLTSEMIACFANSNIVL